MIDRLLPADTQAYERAPEAPRKKEQGDFAAWVQGQPADAYRAAAHGEPAVSNASDAAAGTEAMPLAVEVELHGPDGSREAVTVPWGLAATGRLAWMGAITSRTTSVACQGEGSIGRIASRVQHRDSFVAADSASPAATASASAMSVAWAGATNPEQRAREHSSIVQVRESLSLLAETWRERLIRLAQRHGHDPVVWVRDFRLDEHAIRDLTQQLRSQARESGFELGRIVVNGREVWRASTHSHALETR